MRELVLISEEPLAKNDTAYASSVSALAKEASVLTNLKEVHLDASAVHAAKATLRPPSVVPPTATLVAKEITHIKTVFQDPKDMVDPIKEQEFLMKLRAFEESDSEGLNNEKPVLGKVSVIRRAKSAISQMNAEQNINEKHPLFSVAWEDVKSRPGDAQNTSDFESKAVDDNASNDDMPTVDEVKRHMELFHLRRSIPPPSAKLRESKSSKHSRMRRAKTAKNR